MQSLSCWLRILRSCTRGRPSFLQLAHGKGTKAFEIGRPPRYRDICRPSSLSVDEPIVSGDHVFVSGRVSLNVKPTGKTCETDLLHWWTVRDGKLASWRDYYDTHALAQAYSG